MYLDSSKNLNINHVFIWRGTSSEKVTQEGTHGVRPRAYNATQEGPLLKDLNNQGQIKDLMGYEVPTEGRTKETPRLPCN